MIWEIYVTCGHKNKQTANNTDSCLHRQTDRHAHTQTHKQTDGQIDMHTDRQTEKCENS